MPITLITGPANAGKAQVVLDEVRRELAHGGEPLLVVPTRADAEYYLRELAGTGTAMGARVERFDGLIEEAVRRAGVREVPLGGIARERLLTRIAERHTGARPSSGMVRALGALMAELGVRRVTPARLSQALARWAEEDGPESSPDDIGAMYGEYSRALQRMGRIDAEQRAVRALDHLRRVPASWRRTPVAFYGFDDLTALQLDAIETLGLVVDAPVTVSLAFEPGRAAFAGRASTFARLQPLAAEHRELRPRSSYYAKPARAALAHLERSLFESDAARVDPGAALRMLEGGGERAELELLARDVAGLLADGMAAEDIAIVMRSPGHSADLLEEVLAASAIPYALERRLSLGDTAVGRALVGLLRCLPGSAGTAPAGELGDLLAWLRSPGLLQRPELADALEIRARRRGALSAGRAREMWEERHWPLETIDQLQAASERGPGPLMDRAARELQWLFLAPRRGRAALLDRDGSDEARALSAGRAALAELRELARSAPELAPSDGPELARVLERVEVFAGQRPAAGAVAVLDPLALRARRVRALYVCCLQEGVFPARGRPQPLLGEQERRRLAETAGLRLGEPEDQLAAERYLLYAAVSRPSELLVLSWHVADDEGEPTARSLFVEDISDLFEPTLGEERRRRPLGAAEPANPGAAGAAAVAEHAAVEVDRLSDARVLDLLRARPWSPSSLEAWIGCPMRWFVERMLTPGAFEPDPEPLARGGLAHAALYDTLEGLRQATGSARLTPARLAKARELLRAALERDELEHPLSVAPERRPGARRRLRADLERFLETAAQAESPLEPTNLEVGFGIDADADRGEASELPAFELAPGAFVRGRIDRIDVSAQGEAVVYDYKASYAPKPDNWVQEGKVQVALYMRVAEELLGLRVAGGFYQPLGGRDPRARGILDSDSAIELDCVRGDPRSREAFGELLDETIELARTAVGEAARGQVEARPRTCGFRGSGCQYPTICRCER
ncbi:MAG TPA: PD-(D/E)XK nuclease family protein [Solirubrobacteraceae bacterium]|jgi:ATP-dependent helicase/DNAse subunit B